MILREAALIAIIAAELLGGVVAIGWKMTQPQPPAPDLACTDALTAKELDRLASNVITADQWRSLGETYMATGYFREAEACHRWSASRRPRNAKFVREWAFALERLGELDQANEQYKRAAQLDPEGSAACQYFIGRNRLRQENVEGALQALTQAGELPAAQYERARLLAGRGHRAEAALLARSLVAEFPNPQQPHRLLYQIALDESDALQACEQWDLQDKATFLLPTPLDDDLLRLRAAGQRVGMLAVREAAKSAFEQGDFAAAINSSRQVLDEIFDPVAADLNGESLFYSGQQRPAAERIEEIIRRLGPTVEHWERLGDTYQALGRRNDARSAWLQATQLAFGVPTRTAHGKLAESYKASSEMTAARQHLAWEALAAGIVELNENNLGAAATALQAAVNDNPDLAAAWYYIGETATRTGDSDIARQAYERCLEAAPHHGRAAARLAGCAVQKSDKEPAGSPE